MFLDLIWLIPVLPGIGAAVNGLVGVRYFSKLTTAAVACATMGGALLLSIGAFLGLLGLEHREHVANIFGLTEAHWISPIALETVDGIGAFEVPWAFRLDPLSGMMILIVTGIGFLIHLYSIAYMDHEEDGAYARFFCYLNLFCFFMLTLVLGSTFLVMFVGWEGVGLCSYLLIGFWYHKKSASDAGKKAFIVNRIGDWGFLLGIFLIFFTFGTLDFRAVAEAASEMDVDVGFGVLSAICLLLFVGAVGKSAQIPLHVWLPDAMEGPTPVSALIHAATMVTAGVYMVGRNAVLFSHAPMVMTIVATVGVLTALMAATIGLVQTDIKKVLAYSTVSQLGYMFLATGVGAFAAAAFHLMTHAFFKALLFLGSGSVIHAMNGEQDMRKMGALWHKMDVTCATMFIGALAIAGIPPFSGFFSKDEILYRTFLSNRWLWGLAVLTAAMTAFYMFRLIFMTFLGEYRGPAGGKNAEAHDADHGEDTDDRMHAWHGPHESPRLMTVPLVVLAVGAVVAGVAGIPAALWGNNLIEHFLELSFTAGAAHVEEGEPLSRAWELGLMAFSVLIAGIGIAVAYHLYVRRPQRSEQLATIWAGTHRWMTYKYYVDELYDATAVRGTIASARGLWTVDRNVVDGAVNGTGWLTRASSWVSHVVDKYLVDGMFNLLAWVCAEGSYVFRRVQTGLIQNYALATLFGVFAFVTVYLVARYVG